MILKLHPRFILKLHLANSDMDGGENGEGPSKSIVSVPRFAVKPMFPKNGMIPKLQESHGLSQTLP